ncbi:MAG: hypothetical protein A4E70_01996 [Syntrophus sp. PtaU1.Bin005]|uniref:hypothetical protein n=1 Tax=Syntrophus sp. (in: bacteria) TaxID=48412 RepID=UPI0009C9ADC8|nr:MAG: hypothetical protein A4E69_01838 [Syntrophus sp. PtaB.Bin138]OPY79894.1 MAG: hypothetical protein A4E70_01996 [Syntrophus sp. PtaU1.Bin005]
MGGCAASFVVPGINAGHITAIAEKAAEWGVDLMNCIPMIPVQDTPFECLGAPADAEMVRVRVLASRRCTTAGDAGQMRSASSVRKNHKSS